MMAYTRNSNLAAYQTVAAHGGVAAADPHRLVLMLMDGALERIAQARGAIDNNAPEARSRLLHRAVDIVSELRASLNLASGGMIAANLADLYEYAMRQLMRANLEARADVLDEVNRMLREIREAWVMIPAAQR